MTETRCNLDIHVNADRSDCESLKVALWAATFLKRKDLSLLQREYLTHRDAPRPTDKFEQLAESLFNRISPANMAQFPELASNVHFSRFARAMWWVVVPLAADSKKKLRKAVPKRVMAIWMSYPNSPEPSPAASVG